jgi:hypothetical protein
MAANFKIFVNRERDNLHLRLAGDFDGSSALDLIRVLSEECGSANRVIIHTDGLRGVHPFGKAVFQRQLPPAGKISPSIVFIGKHAEGIAPHSEETASRQVSIH